MMTKFRLHLLLGLLPMSLWGQQAQTPVDSALLNIQPIPATEVPTYVEANKQTILEIQRSLLTPEAVKEIKLGLPNIDSTVRVVMTHFDTTDLGLYTLDQLAKSETEWQRRLDQLSGWNETVADRLTQLKDWDVRVISALQTWEITLQSFEGLDVPQTISDDIIQSEEELKVVQDSLSERMAQLLTVQSTSSQLVNKISERLSRIGSQREDLLRNIFTPERPPLWRISKDSLEFNLVSGVKDSVITASKLTASYFENRPGAIFLTVLVFLLILSTLVFYKYRLKRTEQVQKSAIDLVLHWPIVSSLLLTWLFVVFSLGDIPFEARNFMALIMLVPLSVILFGLLGRKLSWVLVFAVFFLFDVLYLVIIDSPFAQRVTLLIFTLATLGILLWLLVTKATSKLVGWAWLVTTVLQVSALVGIGALVANLVGSVQLSELMLLGTIGSIVTGIILYAIAYLLVALISVVLTLPIFQKSILIRNYESLLTGRVRRLLYFIGVLWWADLTLEGFKLDKEVYGWLTSLFEITWQIGSLALSPGDLMAFVLTLLVAIWVSRFVRFFLEEEVFRRTHLPKGVPGTITMLIRYGTITLGLLLAVAAAGIELDKLAIVLGALGVGIGFGLQDIINNLISGIVLALERPVQVGDVVQVDELMGIVKEIGFRASKVRTYEGSEVIRT